MRVCATLSCGQAMREFKYHAMIGCIAKLQEEINTPLQKAIENGHRNSGCSWIFPLNMMIFYGKMLVHQRVIRRTHRKVQHEPSDESKAFNNYTIIAIFWWMNIHLPVNLMLTKDAFDTSPCATWGSWRESPDWQVPWSIHWRWMQNWHKQIHCEMTKKTWLLVGGVADFWDAGWDSLQESFSSTWRVQLS